MSLPHRRGLRPCAAETTVAHTTPAAKELLDEATCWVDWHTGRITIRHTVERLVPEIERQAVHAYIAQLASEGRVVVHLSSLEGGRR